MGFWVDVPFAENVGMDHAGAENFKPASVFADAAAAAAAGGATYVDFHARFHERKIAGAKTGGDFLAEELGEKLFHRGHKIGKGDVFIDVNPFDLMEEDV